MARLSYADFLKTVNKPTEPEKPVVSKPLTNEAIPVVQPSVAEKKVAPPAPAVEKKPAPAPPPTPPKPKVAMPVAAKKSAPVVHAPNVGKPAPKPSSVPKLEVPASRSAEFSGESTTNRKNRIASQQHQLVCFQLGGEEYAIDIMDVQEIFEPKSIHPLPNQPKFILGITKVREKTIPVVDIAYRMGLDIPDSRLYPFLMIVSIRGEVIGLAVERVTEVRLLERNVLEIAPSLPKSGDSDFFDGIYIIEGKLLIVLRVERILTTAEIADLSHALSAVKSSYAKEK